MCPRSILSVRRRVLGAMTVLALLLRVNEAQAIRPFITDDARVVGGKVMQLETWWRRDKGSFQHWALFAVGPNDHVELTLGGVYGVSQVEQKPIWAFSTPVAQGKFLLKEAEPNRWPGLALAGGILPPFGTGGFEAPGWSGFAYAAVTESLFENERLLIHGNLGAFVLAAKGYAPVTATWGVGTQLRTVAGFHLVGELFSGDPYVSNSGGATQLGFRYIFNDHIQLDATVGTGIFGVEKLPVWATSGVRIVSHKLW